MNIGIPVAFLVSEPRLWASVEGHKSNLAVLSSEKPTPRDDYTNGSVGSARDTKYSKVSHVYIVRHRE